MLVLLTNIDINAQLSETHRLSTIYRDYLGLRYATLVVYPLLFDAIEKITKFSQKTSVLFFLFHLIFDFRW